MGFPFVPSSFAPSEKAMPNYCYTRNGNTIQRSFRMGKAPRTVSVGRRVFRRDMPAEWRGQRDICGNWPKLSDALGVLPSQAKEAAEHLASEGVPTDFTSQGRCRVESNGHQNRIMEVLGMHDNDAGYGNRAPP